MNARSWFFSGIAVCLNIPVFVYAQQGLVPCGRTGQDDCQTCHVVQLVSGVNAWLVGILAIVATIMFVIAGFRLVTSNGNPSVLQDAKSMIINVAIGFTIVLSAWLLLDLFMKSLLSDTQQGLGPWNQIKCVPQPVAETKKGKLNITIMESAPENCTTAAACAELQSKCESRPDGVANITGNPGNFNVSCSFTTSGVNPPDLSATGACDASTVAKYFPSEVSNAQCIIRDESTCGAKMVSTTDVLDGDKRAFSFGPMQINLTVHELVGCGPGGSTLDCKAAFNRPTSGKRRDYRASIINEDLYQRCATAAQNVDCNLSNGKRLRERKGSWGDWSTAAGCGL